MYISEFILGVLSGALGMFVLLILSSLVLSSKIDKEVDEDAKSDNQ